MTSDKNNLIEWIHALDNEKLLSGFITEAYFRRKIAPTQLGLTGAAFGWFTGSLPNDDQYQYRYWLKVVPPSYEPSPTEIALIEKYCQTKKNKFFFLHPSLVAVAPNTEKVPVAFEISQWDFSTKQNRVDVRTGDAANTKSYCLLKEAISGLDKKLSGHLERKDKASARSRLAPVRIDGWLNHSFTEEEVFYLLATRCAIDLICERAVDRDAINLDGQGKLQFIEFKRKYPSENGWWQLVSSPSFYMHKREAYRLDTLFRDKFDKAEAKLDKEKISSQWEAAIRAELGQPRIWQHVEGKCFGLDLSHVRSVVEAQREGYGYVHVIWNERETKLAELLDPDLNPKKGVITSVIELTEKKFKGVTVTPGIKASSFCSRPRMQLVFPAE
ncbi:MAG TPA: hypothetical protein VJ577_08520 [Burkholderiaceae bacterium]|nr:hypothetical protein [Burkholderiaceae bacterium]